MTDAATARSDELIRTRRLDLHLLPAHDVVRLFENPEDPAPWIGRPYANPYRVLVDDPGPLPYRARQVREDPSVNRWLVRLVVLRDRGDVIGNLGLHGAPNEAGMVEVGLSIHPAFRRRGYATEAAIGMLLWACDQAGVRTLRWSAIPDNVPSIRIAEALGFRHVGEQMDEEDGLELVYEVPAAEFAARHGGG
jgi:RimJ/RimL family protein N-acetyltransferase